MSIATRTGDKGTTGLAGGSRVPKHHPRIAAVGLLDSANVEIGAAKLACARPEERGLLEELQRALVLVMGEVATEPGAKVTFSRIADAHLKVVDDAVAAIEARLPPPKGWSVPGASPRSVALDRARVAVRAAERGVSLLEESCGGTRPLVLQWINRVSDLLWLMAQDA